MAVSPVMQKLSEYIAAAADRPLPPEVAAKTKHHVLDTLASMVSGSRLKPGELAIAFARSQGGAPEATVIGSDVQTTAINAAMCNGYMAHADETDDSHAPSLTHPGCAVVPAAFAMAERQNAGGEALLRAVTLGYDVGSRIGRLMNDAGRVSGFATHAFGPLFGCAAAAASLARLNPKQVRDVLAYTAQQASGVTSWQRDGEHVEKAFVFAGMGARNGVTSAVFVQHGFSGEEDAFAGDHNFLEVFCKGGGDLEKWVDNLGEHYDIMITNFKKFCVGSPIQAPADAMEDLLRTNSIPAASVQDIAVHLPPHSMLVVNGRHMPDVNCQYILAAMVLDGKLTFKAAHDYGRMSAPDIQALVAKTRLVGDDRFAGMEAQRPGLVRVTMSDGRTLEKLVERVRGTADNPMTQQEVADKAIDLLTDITGAERARKLVDTVWGLDQVASVRELRGLLTA